MTFNYFLGREILPDIRPQKPHNRFFHDGYPLHDKNLRKTKMYNQSRIWRGHKL